MLYIYIYSIIFGKLSGRKKSFSSTYLIYDEKNDIYK